MLKRVLSLLIVTLTFNAYSEIHPDAGKVSLWLRQGKIDTALGSKYDCAVFLPKDYDPDSPKKYPMVLSIHGFNGSVMNPDHTEVGGRKSGFIKQVWDTPLAETYEAIVIAPHRSPKGFNLNALWSHRELRALIIEAMSKYKIDPDRIVATGYSSGSIATQMLIRFSKDLVAGGLGGAFAPDVLHFKVCSVADVPLWSFGNSTDPLYRFFEWKLIRRIINRCPNTSKEFKLSVYNSLCNHGCWDNHWARTDVQEWLINQKKKPEAPRPIKISNR